MTLRVSVQLSATFSPTDDLLQLDHQHKTPSFPHKRESSKTNIPRNGQDRVVGLLRENDGSGIVDMKVCTACNTRFDTGGWECPTCHHAPPQIGGFPALSEELAHSSDGFNPEYFAQLASLEAGNFWFQSRNTLILMLLKRHCPALKSFLEIGCGTGFVLTEVAANFPAAALTGAEIHSTGLEFAAHRLPDAQFMQMDARHIPLESHFDALGAFDVLEHIEEDGAVLAQIHQALKPEGILILTVPQHPRLWSKQDEMACHVRRYTATELKQKVSNAGFEVVDAGSFVALLLPLMWLSRHRGNTDKDGEHDAMAELRIGTVANFLLKAIMSIELFFTRIGIRFPAGGSLFLVARKAHH